MNIFEVFRLNISAAECKSDLICKLGPIGYENGSRTAKIIRRTTESCEAFAMRRYLLHKAKNGQVAYPITVEHGDAPDFWIHENNDKYGLEYTEVSPAIDAQKFAIETGVRVVGNYDEIGSSAAIVDALQQTQDAINRKAYKTYSLKHPIDLLLYPNSEAHMWVSLFKQGNTVWNNNFNYYKFRNVYVLINNSEIRQIN